MAQSIKLGDNTYLDASGVAVDNVGNTLALVSESFTNSVSTTYLGATHTFEVYRIGRLLLVYMNLNLLTTFPVRTEITIVTLPEKFRPDFGHYFTIITQNGSSGILTIKSDGSVTLYLSKELTGTNDWFRGMFPTKT